MDADVALIANFVTENRKPMSAYLREKIIAAGAKGYVDSLGKVGIQEMDRESAGVLLDLACVLMRRVQPNKEWSSEAILHQFPEDLQKSIKLPRSEWYHSAMAQLGKMKALRTRPEI